MPTRLSAEPAVVVVIFGTFGGTHIAELGAGAADIVEKVRVPTHERRSSPANMCAVTIQADACSQGRYIAFFQASICAVLTCLGAMHTRFDARTILMVRHERSLAVDGISYNRPTRQLAADSLLAFPLTSLHAAHRSVAVDPAK